MIQTLRAKILTISTATVIGALAVTGAATYSITRSNTFATIEQDLDAITAGNATAIDQWVAAKGLAVQATAAVVEHGDPQGFVRQLSKSGGFPITTVGWEDKTFFSTTTTAPGYDPTARPWYKTAAQAGKLSVTKPYGDSTTGVPMGFVVNSDGLILAHADPKLALKPATEVSPLLAPAALADLTKSSQPLQVDMGGA
eukprot:gene24957-31358_t